MLLFLSIILGLLVGAVRRGNIFRLGSLRWLWIAVLPLGSVFLYKYYPTIPYFTKAVVTTFSYICAILFAAANRRHTVAAVLLICGTLSNYIVIAANGFRMPISPAALSVYGNMTAEAVLAQRADYFVATEGAKLMFLGDIIYMPIKIFKGFLSVGDILLAAGMFILIVQAMGKNLVGNKKAPAKTDK